MPGIAVKMSSKTFRENVLETSSIKKAGHSLNDRHLFSPSDITYNQLIDQSISQSTNNPVLGKRPLDRTFSFQANVYLFSKTYVKGF